MRGKLSLEELRDLIARGDVDTVVTAFPDMYGRFMGKRITGHYFLDHVVEGGVHACDYLLACDIDMDPVPGYAYTSWAKGYGDFACIPDIATLRLVPWIDRTALVICDIADEKTGELVSVAPRSILKRQIEKAKNLGFVAKGATELEFFLFKDSFEEARKKDYAHLETYGWYIEDYHVLQSTKEEWFIRAIRNGMDGAGVPVEFSKGEWGPGQHEINLAFAEFLEMADRHSIYKHGVKEIAALNGVSTTFMAKWHHDHAGNSCHIHASLWNDGDDSSAFAGDDALGMSETFRHWLGGQLKHVRDFTLLYAPYVNSYKRYQSGSFAPTKVTYSYDNRTSAFRLVGHGNAVRAENRIPGADCNPYLAFAATLAAGLDGIENSMDPGQAYSGDAYADTSLPEVPHSIDEAIETFSTSEFTRLALGDEVVDHYSHMGRTELRKFLSVVTDYERLRGFERG